MLFYIAYYILSAHTAASLVELQPQDHQFHNPTLFLRSRLRSFSQSWKQYISGRAVFDTGWTYLSIGTGKEQATSMLLMQQGACLSSWRLWKLSVAWHSAQPQNRAKCWRVDNAEEITVSEKTPCSRYYGVDNRNEKSLHFLNSFCLFCTWHDTCKHFIKKLNHWKRFAGFIRP